MAFTLKINSVTRSARQGTLSIDFVANGADTMTCEVVSTDASFRPSVGHTIELLDGSTAVFGGKITLVSESGLSGPTDGIISRVEASGYSGLMNTTIVGFNWATGWWGPSSYSSESLKSRLTNIVDAEFVYPMAVTVDSGMATGPTVEATSYYARYFSDVLNDLSLETGYVWRVSPDAKIGFYEPASTAAPFNVSSGSNQVGDIAVESSKQDYANVVVVKYGGDRVLEKTDTFTGDGATTSFELTYTLVSSVTVGRGYVINNGAYETLSLVGEGATWEYDPSDNTITRTSAPASSAAISITYDAQFPAYVYGTYDSGEILSNGYAVGLILTRDDVTDYATAKAIANAETLIRQSALKTIRYTTFTSGLRPGQTQTITVSERDLSSYDVVITAVTATNDVGANRLRYSVTAVTDGGLLETWRDTIAGWSGGGQASAVGGPGVVTSLGPQPSYTAHAYGDFTFSVNSGSVTVASGDFTACRSKKDGKDLHIKGTLVTMTTTGSPTAIRMTLPPGYTAAGTDSMGKIKWTEDGFSTQYAGDCFARVSGNYLEFKKSDGSAFAAVTNLLGIVFDIHVEIA